MSFSFRLSLNSPQMSILVIKSYIEPPKYSSVLQLNLLYANRSDSEVAWQFLLTSPSLSSLPVTASGSESGIGKYHRVLRESRIRTGTKSPSAHTIACCVGSAKPGAREKFTSGSEKCCHWSRTRGKKDVRKQRKKGELKEEVVIPNLARQKEQKCQTADVLPDAIQLSLSGPPCSPLDPLTDSISIYHT